MKKYSEPEIEILSFETCSVMTESDVGTPNPDLPGGSSEGTIDFPIP